MAANENQIDPAFKFLFQTTGSGESLRLDIPKRYLIFTGGRGSMKSHSLATWVCWNTTFPYKQRTLYSRYTLTSAEISIIPEFLEKVEMLGMGPMVHSTSKKVVNTITGSDILFRGIKTSSGNQTAKLKSIPGLNVFVVDEAEEFESEKDFDTIDESIRAADVPNIIILILNPSNTEHWIYKRFFEGWTKYINIDGFQIPMSTHPEVIHTHTTYLDNLKNLSQSFIDKAHTLKQLNPKKYAHRFLGKWLEQAEGVVYENWKEGEFDESLPYCFALDYGYFPDPLALVKVAVDKKRKLIYVKEYCYQTKLSTEDIHALIDRSIERRNDLIIADTNEKATTASLKKRFNVKSAMKGKGSVGDGIRDIQDYMIIVDPESHNIKKELNNYAWNDKKAGIPIDDYNHALDAMRYGFKKMTKKNRGVRA